VSTDYLNRSPFGVLVVIPLSSSSPPLRIHVDVPAGEAGLKRATRIKCDQIGNADLRRFRPHGRIGCLSAASMCQVEAILRLLLEL
jgi:mRNA-degrading endonuclease toxin of MazEF toxin-antitoxin module